MKKWIVFFAGMILPLGLLADGFIIPEPGINMAVKYHHVNVTIDNQVAHTEIDQVFLNDTDMDSVEAIYVFPLPEEATFSNFILYVDGEPLEAETLDADSAREFYESIVRRNLDPALLEYIGTNTFRARIWPIRAHGERRIQISYDEILHYDNGLIRYLYPLSTEKFSSKPLESVIIRVSLASPDPVKSIYSPSHTITTQKTDDYHADILYEDENVTPDTDFLLYYTVSDETVGMQVLTYREPGEEGFYLLLAAPKVEISTETVISKRTIFVIDRSGSMSGDKIVQARDALKFCINSLNPGDQFNIIDFSSEIRSFKNSPISAQADHLSEALTYVNGLEANGGTNINEALLESLSDMQNDAYTNMIIFLTDGQPTVGETNDEMILSNTKTANTRNSRLFVFGVGYDVNTHLLDRLAEENSGVSAYVSPDENIEVAVSGLFEKISMPVLSDCALDFGSISVADQFPGEVPDLFKGSQLVQLGKYLSNGTQTVTLAGNANGETLTFSCEADFAGEATEYDFIPRLWAIRKVGALLDQIRLIGENEELVDEVTQIAKRYGIITPYTSFLINEDVAPADNFLGIEDKSGAVAFDNAVNIGAWRNAENANSTSSVGVKYVGNKTFFNRDNTWVDAQYDSSDATRNIEFGSSEYFTLLKENPELSTYYALGNNVRFSYEGNNYQITTESAVTPPPVPDPDDYELYQNVPNPFNPSTEIRFLLHSQSAIRISIYNTAGQHVQTLFEGVKPQGQYFVTWDGKDAKGIEMASGIYLVKLSGDIVLTRKIMLVR